MTRKAQARKLADKHYAHAADLTLCLRGAESRKDWRAVEAIKSELAFEYDLAADYDEQTR